MKCHAAVNLDTDMPLWVSRTAFQKHFDQRDFLCRNVVNVTDAYLLEWFYFDTAGLRHFLLPPVSVINKTTIFISGRHRTAVLLKHLDAVPLSFDYRFISKADRIWIESIAGARVDLTVEIALPDLPVRDTLP